LDRMPTLEELQTMAGQELYRVTSPPVSLSDIRKHAIAVYWPEKPPRRFWDEDYARQTSWGGIVAPEDFNPFAWPIEGPGRLPNGVDLPEMARTFNGGSDAEYFSPVRPGDVVTAVETMADAFMRTGRSGRLLMLVSEVKWTNQRNEPVKNLRGTRVVVLPD